MFAFSQDARVPKLNLALWGPAGAGKTYTGLAIAHQLGERVAVVDTEHLASTLYRDRFPAAFAALNPPFAPERFIEALHDAEQAGFDVLMIDSLSPEWDGEGGCLWLAAQTDANGKKRGARAWGEVTPRHDALLTAMNQSPLSLVITLREKPRVILGKDANGKATVEQGEATPVMRERFEYEYDLVMHIDRSHRMTATKSRFLDIPEDNPESPSKSKPIGGKELLAIVHRVLHPEPVSVG